MHERPKPMKMSEPAIYRPILMKFGTHINKNVPSPKNTTAAISQDSRHRYLKNQ
jgi:hypothetical protein